MSVRKEKLHDITKAAKNGAYDDNAFADGLAHFNTQSDHYGVKNLTITKTPTTTNGFKVVASWEVVEKDPKVPAVDHA